MCVIKAFNFILVLFKIKKRNKSQINRTLLESRDQWRNKCINQSHNYLKEIKRLNNKLEKYKLIDLS